MTPNNPHVRKVVVRRLEQGVAVETWRDGIRETVSRMTRSEARDLYRLVGAYLMETSADADALPMISTGKDQA